MLLDLDPAQNLSDKDPACHPILKTTNTAKGWHIKSISLRSYFQARFAAFVARYRIINEE